MRRIKGLLRTFWQIATRPSAYLSVGFLTLGGFLGGVLFWGAFNTALEATNTETFCVSCHEMAANPYEELTRTVHFTNRSGVRAHCSDCHVPHEWTHKIARKMQASKEVWGHIFGTIDTRQKFLDERLRLAKHEWSRLKSNDSLECRNCHSTVAMDFTRQTTRAADIHQRFLMGGGDYTCIDCHKGIAHELPDMTGIDPGWLPPAELRQEFGIR
jgi:cytochrome c-type protein NapC